MDRDDLADKLIYLIILFTAIIACLLLVCIPVCICYLFCKKSGNNQVIKVVVRGGGNIKPADMAAPEPEYQDTVENDEREESPYM